MYESLKPMGELHPQSGRSQSPLFRIGAVRARVLNVGLERCVVMCEHTDAGDCARFCFAKTGRKAYERAVGKSQEETATRTTGW